MNINGTRKEKERHQDARQKRHIPLGSSCTLLGHESWVTGTYLEYFLKIAEGLVVLTRK